MLPQLERQFLQANLAQVQSFLSEAEQEDDPIGIHQYRQLVAEFRAKLSGAAAAVASAPASLALFFGGRPVLGSYGIDAEFSSRAIEMFQKIVSQRFASEEFGPLSQKGRVPLKGESRLLVTDVVRGSFGYVLEEARQGTSSDDATASDAELKQVIGQVADTLSRVTAQDDAMFESAVGEIDDRQKGALTEFFKLLDTEGATLRLVEGERDFALDQAAIARARQRVENLVIKNDSIDVQGMIGGWLDIAAKFELQPHEGTDLIQGSVARELLNRLSQHNIEPYHKHFRATVKVREVTVRNRQPKLSYTLTDLTPIEEPAAWRLARPQVSSVFSET